MDLITARYELIIYNGGERIELKRLDNQAEEIDLSKCSSRISQILATVIEMKKQMDDNPASTNLEIYSNAISKVAKNLEVNNTTIIDKLTRQIDLNAEQSREIIFEYLENNSPELKNVLLEKVGKNTKSADVNAINQVIV